MSFDKSKYLMPGTSFRVKEPEYIFTSNEHSLEKIIKWDDVSLKIEYSEEYSESITFETIPYLNPGSNSGIYLSGTYVLFKVDDIIHAVPRSKCTVLIIK